MSGSAELLQCYTELAVTVTRMVELARARDWAPLPALDTRCSAIVERLRGMSPPELATFDRARAGALLERIRIDQDELAALVQPQLLRLMHRIDELQLERKVRGAYGAA